MWLFAAITASGILGVILQNYLPRMMMERVERETLYDQIPRTIEELRREADERVEFITADLGIQCSGEARSALAQPCSIRFTIASASAIASRP